MSLPLSALLPVVAAPAAAPAPAARFPVWYGTWTREAAREPSAHLPFVRTAAVPAYLDADNFYFLSGHANTFLAYSRTTGLAVPASNRAFTGSFVYDPIIRNNRVSEALSTRVYVDPAGGAWIQRVLSGAGAASTVFTYRLDYLAPGASAAARYLPDTTVFRHAFFRTADRFYAVETGSGGREFGRAYTYPAKARASADDVRLGLSNPAQVIAAPPYALYVPHGVGSAAVWPYDTRIKAPSNAYVSTYAEDFNNTARGGLGGVLLDGDLAFVFFQTRGAMEVAAFRGTGLASGYGGGLA